MCEKAYSDYEPVGFATAHYEDTMVRSYKLHRSRRDKQKSAVKRSALRGRDATVQMAWFTQMVV